MNVVACVHLWSRGARVVAVDPTRRGDPWCGQWIGEGDDDAAPTGMQRHAWRVNSLLEEVERDLDATIGQVVIAGASRRAARLALLTVDAVAAEQHAALLSHTTGAVIDVVISGRCTDPQLDVLRESNPDVTVVTGNFDGADPEPYLHNVAAAAMAGLRGVVIAAGQSDAAEAARSVLCRHDGGIDVVANMSPAFGLIDPEPLRAAIRGVGADDVPIRAIEELAAGRSVRYAGRMHTVLVQAADILATDATCAGGVLVVDYGHDSVDIHSGVPDDSAAGRHTHAYAVRTSIEADLAPAAAMEDCVAGVCAAGVAPQADVLAAARAITPGERSFDTDAPIHQLRRMVVTAAMRRHAKPTPPQTEGVDLRRVSRIIATGTVINRLPHAIAHDMLSPTRCDHAGGWRVPRSAHTLVDSQGRLFAAGLMAQANPAMAGSLLVPYRLSHYAA